MSFCGLFRVHGGVSVLFVHTWTACGQEGGWTLAFWLTPLLSWCSGGSYHAYFHVSVISSSSAEPDSESGVSGMDTVHALRYTELTKSWHVPVLSLRRVALPNCSTSLDLCNIVCMCVCGDVALYTDSSAIVDDITSSLRKFLCCVILNWPVRSCGGGAVLCAATRGWIYHRFYPINLLSRFKIFHLNLTLLQFFRCCWHQSRRHRQIRWCFSWAPVLRLLAQKHETEWERVRQINVCPPDLHYSCWTPGTPTHPAPGVCVCVFSKPTVWSHSDWLLLIDWNDLSSAWILSDRCVANVAMCQIED